MLRQCCRVYEQAGFTGEDRRRIKNQYYILLKRPMYPHDKSYLDINVGIRNVRLTDHFPSLSRQALARNWKALNWPTSNLLPIQPYLNFFVVETQRARNRGTLVSWVPVEPDQVLGHPFSHQNMPVLCFPFIRASGFKIAFAQDGWVDRSRR